MDTNANASGTITNGIAVSQDIDGLPFQSTGNYPGVVTCANQRVLWGGSVNDPQQVWSSAVGIFDSYGSMLMQFFEQVVYTIQVMTTNASGQPLDASGNVVTAAAGNTPAYTSIPQFQEIVGDADGFTGQIYSDQNDAIQWIVSAIDIIIGTLTGQVLIPGDSTANTFSFSNISRTGCADIQAYFMTGGIVFVDRAARRVMLLNWQGVNIQLLPPDTLSVFSEHLFSGGSGNAINQICFSTSPVMRLWFLQNDGTLVCCEYDDKYDVKAWWNFITDGTIVSIEVGQGTNEDILYMIVNRNGHYILEQLTTPYWTTESGAGGVQPAIFTDASVYAYNATPFTTVSGLTNLNGEDGSDGRRRDVSRDCRRFRWRRYASDRRGVPRFVQHRRRGPRIYFDPHDNADRTRRRPGFRDRQDLHDTSSRDSVPQYALRADCRKQRWCRRDTGLYDRTDDFPYAYD